MYSVTGGKKKCIMFIRTSGVRDDVISNVTDTAGVEERVWRWCSVLAVLFGPPTSLAFPIFGFTAQITLFPVYLMLLHIALLLWLCFHIVCTIKEKMRQSLYSESGENH